MKKYHPYSYPRKCCDCGKFCLPADSSTSFGSSLDLEPPEPEYYCKKCVKRYIDQYINCDEMPIMGCYWHRPNFIAVCKSIRRHVNKSLKHFNKWFNDNYDKIMKHAQESTRVLIGKDSI